MKTTANKIEMYEIINSEHRNPHNILGIHEIIIDGEKAVAIRAFIPQASSIKVIEEKNTSLKYDMEKIHEAGFFEIVFLNKKEKFKYKLEITAYNNNQWITYDP